MNERERAFQTALQSAIRNAAEAGETAQPVGPGSDTFQVTPQDLLDTPELFWVGGECADGADWTPDVGTFQEAGVMTGNAGLVVTLPTGEQFQVTIVQSVAAPPQDLRDPSPAEVPAFLDMEPGEQRHHLEEIHGIPDRFHHRLVADSTHDEDQKRMDYEHTHRPAQPVKCAWCGDSDETTETGRIVHGTHQNCASPAQVLGQ
jgi:hypothetical protein